MYLSKLLKKIVEIPGELDREIVGLSLDSRKILPQEVFIAVHGTQSDGSKYILDAIHRGCAAVLIEKEELNFRQENNIPIISIPHLQKKMNELAAIFYQFPAKDLRVIGITGTNGKTTCSHLIAEALQFLKIPCGIIGTLGNGFHGNLHETALTTPDGITLQKIFHELKTCGAKAVAMEVSSHSIHQNRISNIEFEIGLFTNLTQDHLDYHGDMDAYANVKRGFIFQEQTKNKIINADDSYGLSWLKQYSSSQPMVAYGVNKNVIPNHIPFVFAENAAFSLKGLKANVISPWGEGEFESSLIGKFNLHNLLAVIATLCVYGIPFKNILSSLKFLKAVPGRMQTIIRPDKPLVVVDYAHTPDALQKTLSALKSHCDGKLICVFGAGGDRDQSKRSKMASAVEPLADQIIITNDNPRHEDPEQIAKHILSGFKNLNKVSIELDRAKAIKNSIQCATVNDCILIAGKGAERYQQFGYDKLPFDDVLKVEQYLN